MRSKKLGEGLRAKNENVNSSAMTAPEKELEHREEEDLRKEFDSLKKSLGKKISKKDVELAVRNSHNER